MKIKLLFFFLFLFGRCGTGLFAQDDFCKPMDIPLYLSGNFGELRSSHFHSGLDIKTGGVEGEKVYAVEDGFVSRIKVSPYGYGKALYIEHPSGHTSVYAHLSAYNDEITAFLRNAQYELESFAVDIYPGRDQLKVNRGDLVALSGNSGGSGGPHLHFEIRETITERPLNPLNLGYNIIDDQYPILKSIRLYPLNDSSWVEGMNSYRDFSTSSRTGNCSLKSGSSIKVGGEVGIGFNAYDQLSGTSNYCGIYRAELYQDGELIFDFNFDKLDFAQRRLIHAHRDYANYESERVSYQRCFRLPNNPLIIYGSEDHDGRINQNGSGKCEMELKISDWSGNVSKLKFELIFEEKMPKFNAQVLRADVSDMKNIPLVFEDDNRIEDKGIVIEIPAWHLFDDCMFYFHRKEDKELLSDRFTLGDAAVPLYKPMRVVIAPKENTKATLDKIVLVNERKGRAYAQSSFVKNGEIVAEVDRFGEYYLIADTTAPIVRPYDFKKDMRKYRDFSFKVADDLAGIEHINGWIDGRWVLLDFDAKRARVTYTFDESRLERGEHHFRIEVKDGVGNATEYSADFVW